MFMIIIRKQKDFAKKILTRRLAEKGKSLVKGIKKEIKNIGSRTPGENVAEFGRRIIKKPAFSITYASTAALPVPSFVLASGAEAAAGKMPGYKKLTEKAARAYEKETAGSVLRRIGDKLNETRRDLYNATTRRGNLQRRAISDAVYNNSRENIRKSAEAVDKVTARITPREFIKGSVDALQTLPA